MTLAHDRDKETTKEQCGESACVRSTENKQIETLACKLALADFETEMRQMPQQSLARCCEPMLLDPDDLC